LSFEELKAIFDKYGKEIDILKKEYRRFKTDNSRKYKNEHKNLYEYLFVYKKHN
jgi:adenine-specific DNA methylase